MKAARFFFLSVKNFLRDFSWFDIVTVHFDIENVQHTKFTKEDYISLGLSNDEGFLTNAGVLIADQNTYLHNKLFCTRWNGLTKTGLDEARDDREIEGSIVNQLIRALDFFEANTHKRWHKESTGRVEEPDYDILAIQEALVNAIIHRDYTELGSEVCLDIYDDRIEISSLGIALW